jgi:hypothetical protein
MSYYEMRKGKIVDNPPKPFFKLNEMVTPTGLYIDHEGIHNTKEPLIEKIKGYYGV